MRSATRKKHSLQFAPLSRLIVPSLRPGRIGFVALMAVFLCGLFGSTLTAREVTLTYGKAPHNPMSYMGAQPLDRSGGEKGWESGSDFLTERAVTARLSSYRRGSDPIVLLVSLDTLAEGAKKHDTIHIDLDHDRILDDGETFPLGPVEKDERTAGLPGHILCAEKIPFGKGTQEGVPPHFNLYYLALEKQPPGSPIIFSLAAWGCFRGEVTLDGTVHDVYLRDRTMNGAFDDFEEEADSPSDVLTVVPRGGEDPANGRLPLTPLRRRILLESGACSLAIREGGKILSIEPLSVEYGTIRVSAPDVVLDVYGKGWGKFSIGPGPGKELPVGDWEITGFHRRRPEPLAMCFYGAPAMKDLTLSPKETTDVALETSFRATVTARSSQDGVDLSLGLTTAEGAQFRAYSADPHPEGIPFAIRDEKGAVVEEGVFRFG